MADPDTQRCRWRRSTWIKPRAGHKVLDRGVGLPGPQPEPAAVYPTSGKAWVEFKRLVHQRDRSGYVLIETTERVCGAAENRWVITGAPERSPGKFYAIAPV